MKDILQGKPIRHPLHPLLVHFPIGLFFFSFILDLASWVFSSAHGLAQGASYSMVLGILTAILAAVPGAIDYSDIRRDHPAKRIATFHMILNLAAVGLYGLNVGLRYSTWDSPQTPSGPLILSLIGILLLSVSGYLGGRLVYDDGISIGRHRRKTPGPGPTHRFPLPAANPAAQKEPSEILFVPTVEASRLKEGETLRLEVAGTVMAVVKLDDKIYAFQEFCTHRFGPLSEGSFRNGEVECPWHRSCFDVRTGKVTKGPAQVDLKVFPVQVRDGKIHVGIQSQVPIKQDT